MMFIIFILDYSFYDLFYYLMLYFKWGTELIFKIHSVKLFFFSEQCYIFRSCNKFDQIRHCSIHGCMLKEVNNR